MNYKAMVLFSVIGLSGCNVEAAGQVAAGLLHEVLAPSDLEQSLSDLEAKGVVIHPDQRDSLAGVDKNDNGIRDDVDQFLEHSDFATGERQALKEFARAQQRIQTVETMSPSLARSITDGYATRYFCFLMSSDTDFSKVDRASDVIVAFTANTPGRSDRHDQYSAAMDGANISLPPLKHCKELGF